MIVSCAGQLYHGATVELEEREGEERPFVLLVNKAVVARYHLYSMALAAFELQCHESAWGQLSIFGKGDQQ